MEFNLSEINSLSNTTKAFVTKDDGLSSIINPENPYYSIANALEGKSNFDQEKRETLVNVLLKDYEFLSSSSEDDLVKYNINSLRDPNTYTVTTGQQLHLFLGPAFVIYKILAVIKLTEELKTIHPNKNFVPVYWLASEDHDFKEIQDTVIFGHEFKWNTEQTGACGRFHLNEVNALIEEIKSKVNLNTENIALIDSIKKIYSESRTLSEATTKLAHQIFGNMGLVCLDADKPDLKRFFIPVIEKDIIENVNIKPFQELSQRLSDSGFHTQLNCREINFFYIKDKLRNRIIFESNLFKVLDTNIEFKREELIHDINLHPENYSPNAVLRPLYQESILPNIAYIGGNAEINYWVQISNLFKINNLNSPNLLLRPSVWIIPIKIQEWLEKVKILGSDLLISQNPEKHLISLGAAQIDLKEKIDAFNTLRKETQDIANQIDKSEFIKLVDLGKSYEKALKNAEKLLLEVEKSKVDNSFKKLSEIYRNYFDIKQMQERKTNSLELWIKYENVAFSLKIKLKLSCEKGYIISI